MKTLSGKSSAVRAGIGILVFAVAASLLAALLLVYYSPAAQAQTRRYDPARPQPLYHREMIIHRARQAQGVRNYKRSMVLLLEVLHYDPDHKEARKLMRQVSVQADRREVYNIQQERIKLFEEGKVNRVRFQKRLARLAIWDNRFQVHIGEHQILEAYDYLYGISEEWLADPWPKEALAQLQQLLPHHESRLKLKDKRYQAAVRGFYFFTERSLPEAKAIWSTALKTPGKPIPEKRIRRYLKWLDDEVSSALALLPEATKEKESDTEKAEKIKLLYAQAVMASGKGDYEAAIPVLVQVLHRDPKHKGALEHMQLMLNSRARAQAREFYLSGLIYYGQGRLLAAMSKWRKALRLDPQHTKAKEALERGREDMEKRWR